MTVVKKSMLRLSRRSTQVTDSDCGEEINAQVESSFNPSNTTDSDCGEEINAQVESSFNPSNRQ